MRTPCLSHSVDLTWISRRLC